MGMVTIWNLTGGDAGTFACVPKVEADKRVASGTAQIADGMTPLKLAENHPDYVPEKPTGKPKKKYPNKMLKTETE